jgi:hypothetical protein
MTVIHHRKRSGLKRWKSSSQIARALIQHCVRLRRRRRAHTELHIREEAERAAAGTALSEAYDINPELHVARCRASVFIHEERKQDACVWCGTSADLARDRTCCPTAETHIYRYG